MENIIINKYIQKINEDIAERNAIIQKCENELKELNALLNKISTENVVKKSSINSPKLSFSQAERQRKIRKANATKMDNYLKSKDAATTVELSKIIGLSKTATINTLKKEGFMQVARGVWGKRNKIIS